MEILHSFSSLSCSHRYTARPTWNLRSFCSHPSVASHGSTGLRFKKCALHHSTLKKKKKQRFASFRALDSNQHRSDEKKKKENGEDQAEIVDDDQSGKVSSQGLETRSIDSSRSVKLVGKIADVDANFVGKDVNIDVDGNMKMDMEGCVLGPSPEPEAWDSGRIGPPVVRRYLSDNEERWIMWYSASGGSLKNEVMGLAISSNGVHWKRGNGLVDNSGPSSEDVGKVLDCSDNWWAFDTEVTRPSDVLVLSSLKGRVTAGVYWMYYTGGSSETIDIPKPISLPPNQVEFLYSDESVTVHRTRPGLAMSHDGRAWARIEGEHHSGALFDGGEGKWDSLFIAAPHVVYSGPDDLRMYYHAFDIKSGCFSIGFARSRDGMKWVKYGKLLGGGLPGTFDEFGVKCPQVVPHPDGNGYLMIYEGVAMDGSISFGLARSKDGLSKWERCSDSPMFSVAEKENAWDSGRIHHPCLVHMDGEEWRLYYQGVDKSGRSGVGMAECSDGKLQKFQRCHIGLHL